MHVFVRVCGCFNPLEWCNAGRFSGTEDELETEIHSNPRMCTCSKYTHPFIHTVTHTHTPHACRAYLLRSHGRGACAVIGSDASTHGCFFLIEMRGGIGTGVCSGLSFGVCVWQFAESRQNQNAGGLVLHGKTHGASGVCSVLKPGSNLWCFYGHFYRGSIRSVCVCGSGEVVQMLQAGAGAERPPTGWWLKLFVWAEGPQHKEDSVLRELINANFVNTHTHTKVLSTAQLTGFDWCFIDLLLISFLKKEKIWVAIVKERW